jgi:3-ketosteroid 9alpha-monooxygenase subunit B
VSPPDGRFVLDPAAGARPLALYGGGSGITPLLSLAKSALATSARSIALFFANRDAMSIIGRAELDALARAHPGRLSLHYHCDDQAGLVDENALSAWLREPAASDHYVCGPGPFMDLVARVLESAGVAPERRFFERFISPLDPDRRAALARAQAARTAADAPAVPASFTLRLDGAVHTVAYAPGLTLLAAARQQGIAAPSSCEDGYCGTCAARLLRGDVSLRSAQALGPDERAGGMILLCQAQPSGAAPLEVDCAVAPRRAPAATATRRPQPLAPRVLASLFVVLMLSLFLWSRSHP